MAKDNRYSDERSFIKFVEDSIRKNWNYESLTDYKGETMKYSDVARRMAELHVIFEHIGVKRGDKIALCGKNSSHWGVVFLATLTYGAVSVPILNDFKPDNIHNIVNHSDSVLLFVGENVWENLDESKMPNLKGIISINTFKMLVSGTSALDKAYDNLNLLFGKKFPKEFGVNSISYEHDRPDDLAYISYTSGTTGFSKGVMIPYRSLWSNLRFAQDNMPISSGDNHVCMLPLAHAFGLMFSFLFEFVSGTHVFFLTRVPSPKIIFAAYADIRPNLIITVPLIVEKVVRQAIFPKLASRKVKMMLKTPILRRKVLNGIRKKMEQLFGGNMIELVIGGAALSEDVENFLRVIRFAYTVGYGMTECGPLIAYSASATFKKSSSGRPVDNMEVKIDSPDGENVVGEILVKGMNVMQGYYKNPDATEQVLMPDGWMRTGDLGVMDGAGNITIRGRCKNMILGPSGQNIYPEEIEDKLNTLPYVAESIVVQQGGKIVALIHPDYELAIKKGLSSTEVELQMDANRKTLNQQIPNFCQVASVKIFPEEFEKTPKRSIKRYLYS